MLKVLPLATTAVDWTTLTEMYKKVLDVVPTRQLDDNGLSVTAPASFVIALNPMNQIDKALKLGLLNGDTFAHSFFTFLAVTDKDIGSWLLDKNLTVLKHKGDEYDIYIVSGTAKEFIDFSLAYKGLEKPKHAQQFVSGIIKVLKSSGFDKVL